ncbi:MAG: hypothetical protein MPJ50_08915 [Pirellulales bacterium]|nr:hypothetical protein [Pirellulales bacterium]
MSNLKKPAKQLALQAAEARKLVRCSVESAEKQTDGTYRIVVSGSLDVDLQGALNMGHDSDDLSKLVSNMRLQVDVKDGQVITEQWLR